MQRWDLWIPLLAWDLLELLFLSMMDTPIWASYSHRCPWSLCALSFIQKGCFFFPTSHHSEISLFGPTYTQTYTSLGFLVTNIWGKVKQTSQGGSHLQRSGGLPPIWDHCVWPRLQVLHFWFTRHFSLSTTKPSSSRFLKINVLIFLPRKQLGKQESRTVPQSI